MRIKLQDLSHLHDFFFPGREITLLKLDLLWELDFFIEKKKTKQLLRP